MPRIPLLGGAYQARSVIAEAQRSINLFAEKNPTDAPTQVTHYPTPGLRTLFSPNPAPPPPPSYVAPAVRLPAGAFMLAGSTGAPSSTVMTFVWFVRVLGGMGDALTPYPFNIQGNAGQRVLWLKIDGNYNWQWGVSNNPLTKSLTITGTAPLSADAWHSFAITCDTSAGTGQAYIDRVASGTLAASGGAFTFVWDNGAPGSEFEIQSIDAETAPGSFVFIDGPDVSDLWCGAQAMDFSVAGNLNKWVSPSNHPINTGTHGELPTGIIPLIKLSGDHTSYPLNHGGGLNYDVFDGPLGDAPSPGPSA